MPPEVVIIGAGPNGLMLACELSLAGIRPVVLERLPEPTTENRANGLVGQVVRLLDRRGLYQRLDGTSGPPQPAPRFVFGALPLDLAGIDDNPLYLLMVPQLHVDRVLTDRAAELGVEVRRGHELTGFTQTAEEVSVDVTGPGGPYRLTTRYLVGADGSGSITRKLAGIGFSGASEDHLVSRLAEVRVPDELIDSRTGGLDLPGYGPIPPLHHRTERGVFACGSFPSRPSLVFTMEWTTEGVAADQPLSLPELRESVRRVLGTDLPLDPPAGEGPHRLSRWIGVNTRLADRYSAGRVLLVGDAAHVHLVVGGPGLNLGLQDAVNLGWKLAGTIHGWAPPGLLDSYETERRPVGERVAVLSRAQLALLAPGAEVTALREIFAELLQDLPNIRHLATTMAGADVRYDPGVDDAHPLAGRGAPDLLLDTGDGPVRLADLTTSARPLFLDLTDDASLSPDVEGWRDRVDLVTARASDTTATALLLRPDCYVAWATDAVHPDRGARESLRTALTAWFGGPSRPPGR